MCRLISMVHIIPVNTRMTANELSWIYICEVVRLHRLPERIVSDRDSKFTSRWWRELHRVLGSKLLMSTSFHPQTDGQTERMNRSVGQIFRATIRRPDQLDWLEVVDLTEFAINSAISRISGYAPFELNYGYMPAFIQQTDASAHAPPGIMAFANQVLTNVAAAHDAIIEQRVFQTQQANEK